MWRHPKIYLCKEFQGRKVPEESPAGQFVYDLASHEELRSRVCDGAAGVSQDEVNVGQQV